jgi:tricorn protease
MSVTTAVMKRHLISLFLVATLSIPGISAADDTRMLRYPDINGDLIAFVYAGDIWTVKASGGEAKRLTSHAGIELFPKISPDGKWILGRILR